MKRTGGVMFWNVYFAIWLFSKIWHAEKKSL